MADKTTELQTTSNNKQLTPLNPERIGRELRAIRTAGDALRLAETDREKYPSLARLRRDFGEDKIEAVVILYLIDLCDNLNLKRPLNDTQVKNIAREIVAEFYALTIADVYLIFRRAKTGDFGELYDSLDMPKVLSWFRAYFSERCEVAAQSSINEAGAYRTRDDRREAERWAAFFERQEKQSRQKK